MDDYKIIVEQEHQTVMAHYEVYQLYGLTYDEVLTIDPETPITREEYESNE